MSPQDRVAQSKDCVTKVVNRLVEVIELDENVKFFTFSDHLAHQIPKSHAAHAFDLCRYSLWRYQIIRLLSVWDRGDDGTHSIQTAIALIDDDSVVDLLAQETFDHWANIPSHRLNPSDDPEIEKLLRDSIKESQRHFAVDQQKKTTDALMLAIRKTKETVAADALRSAQNVRHHLAHNLSQTRIEKSGPVNPLHIRDAAKLLEESISITEGLYSWVNGVSFDFADCRRIAAKRAKELWENCTFQITDFHKIDLE